MKRYTKTTTTKPNRIFLPLEYEIKISQSAKITNLSPETRCHLLLQTKGNKSEPKDPTLTHIQLHKKRHPGNKQIHQETTTKTHNQEPKNIK